MTAQNMTLYSYTFTPLLKGGVYEVVFARGIGEIMFTRPELFHTHQFYADDKVATHAIPENKIEVHHEDQEDYGGRHNPWVNHISTLVGTAVQSCSDCLRRRGR